MKKLFISQPMKGRSDEEIINDRRACIKYAKEMLGEDVEVIDSFFRCAPADGQSLWYLGDSLKLLAQADIAYFDAGWVGARGCKIEHSCAVEYGVPIIEADNAVGVCE